MNKKQRAAALVACLIAAAASADEPEIPKSKAYDVLTYTLITHDEFTARQLPGQTARIDSFLTQQLATGVHTPNAPTFIWVMPPGLWRRYFETSDYIDSEFVPARFANYLLLQHSVNSHDVRKALFHEYTHLFLRSQLKRYYPLWLDEGMATLIQYSRFHDTEVEIGVPLTHRGAWIPLARLFQLDRSSPEYLSEAQALSVHYGSWTLVHRAFIEDPVFNKQLFDFLGALNNFNPIERAFQQSFGMNADELDLRMRRYAQQITNDAFFQVKIPPVAPPRLPSGRSMSEVESLELLAEVMLASGTRADRLAEVIDAAHRKAPDSPKVLALRMQMAVRDRDDAALSRLVAESEPRISDTRVARGVGLALFERVRESNAGDTMSPADRERMSRRAFELLDRAVMSKPDDVEAIWGYAMLAARLKQDLATAMRRLDSGLAIANFNADLAMAAALVYEARGEQKQMVPFLVLTARMTRRNEQRAWAISRVNEILASQAAVPAATK